MGVLANHVPSIEQLRPGLVEIVEESGGSKQFFRTNKTPVHDERASQPLPSLFAKEPETFTNISRLTYALQSLEASQSYSQVLS